MLDSGGDVLFYAFKLARIVTVLSIPFFRLPADSKGESISSAAGRGRFLFAMQRQRPFPFPRHLLQLASHAFRSEPPVTSAPEFDEQRLQVVVIPDRLPDSAYAESKPTLQCRVRKNSRTRSRSFVQSLGSGNSYSQSNSQSRKALSLPPESTYRPSGLKQTEFTQPVWPHKRLQDLPSREFL